MEKERVMEPQRTSEEQRYLDLLAYVVSNAIAGEIMAIDNYTSMVSLLSDTDEKIETVMQAKDEAKHVQALAKLGRRLDFPTRRRIIEPQWRRVGAYVAEQAARGDLASCIIAQDIMVETMAVVAYRTLQRNTDIDTTKLAANILEDELAHLQIGIDRLKAMLDRDDKLVHERLRQTHEVVMPELFSMISYRCHSLCGDLGVVCSNIGLDSIRTDIDAVRVEALDTYMEKLDRVGFDTKVTAPLIAQLEEFGERPWIDEAGGGCHTGACHA
jgi:fatty aldehyde decarbonylase